MFTARGDSKKIHLHVKNYFYTIGYFMKAVIFGLLCALLSTAHAEENALKGMKLGFGFDRGFGVIATKGKFNGFLGNDGIAVDYLLKRETLELEIKGPVFWYVSGGGYIDWDGDFGARLPVGAEWQFAKNLDAYAQVMPRLQFKDDFRFGLDFGMGVRYQF